MPLNLGTRTGSDILRAVTYAGRIPRDLPGDVELCGDVELYSDVELYGDVELSPAAVARMGCEFGKPQVVSTVQEEPETEMTGFSDTQIDTIRSTWPLLSNEGTRVGVEVFVRIFREAPSIHALFHHYKVNNVEDLHRSTTFQSHASRFMSVIQNLVDHLECPQNVDQQLLILGAKHATFEGYHPEYFRFYTKCMMDVWEMELGEEFIHEVRDSWRLAFEYIVERMTEGFHMCLNGHIQEILGHSMPPSTSVKGQEDRQPDTAGRLTDTDDGLVRVQ